jgi:hypothetical protein
MLTHLLATKISNQEGESMEHKIARICWNDHRWQRPSGKAGKTRNKGAFEYINGFGHEEWLFDTAKVINGYHYGFIQAVAAARDRYEGKAFHLSLYSIDDRSKQRWWLGTIRNASVVSEVESTRIYDEYEKRGWLEQMRTQMVATGADVRAFRKHVTPKYFAVLKFRIEDLDILAEPLEFQYGDPAVASDYYNLKNYIQQPAFLALSSEFSFRCGHTPATDKKRLVYGQHDRDVNNHHNHIQTQLFAKLCKKYGSENVGTENNTGAGSRVDLVVRRGKKYDLYELKIGPSLQACVREAVGQLLEYRHSIGHSKVARLVIVSPHTPDQEVDSYLEFMRNEHAIPIHYEQCTA